MLKSAIQIEAAARLGPFIRAANIAMTLFAIVTLLTLAAIAALFGSPPSPDERARRQRAEPDAA